MNSTILERAESRPSRPPGLLERLAERGVRQRLAGITQGRLNLVAGATRASYGAAGGLEATVHVLDPRLWAEMALDGSIGAGHAYMQEWWRAEDLTSVLRIMLQNRAVLDGMETGTARLLAPAHRLAHWLRRNTRGNSRRNIEAHYDLGNELFAQFLDPTLMYSSAIFEEDSMSLEAAQRARLRRICAKLALSPQDHLLEIGCGWGALAIHAAREHGCRVTATTLSREQYELARERIAAANLSDRIELLLEDYRELRGRYDKLVSIEMIEAVGHQYYDTYFQRCASLLAQHGLMLLQGITIADQQYERARRCVDFIQKFIFPGSTIPSVTALLTAATRASDLRLVHLEDIGPHYARTLREWRLNFQRNAGAVRALGYSDVFRRMWEFYFCYCEAGFEERALGDAQMLLAKPGNRRTALLGRL